MCAYEAWDSISDNKRGNVTRRAIFPRGLKLTQTEDADFFASKSPANADFRPDFESESESDSDGKPGTDSDPDSDSDSDSQIDSGCSEDISDTEGGGGSDRGKGPTGHDEVEIVWAKASQGIWGLGHMFEGLLYFTRDIVDSSVLRESYKLPRPGPPSSPPSSPPKPKPKPNVKPRAKEQRKGAVCDCSACGARFAKRFRCEPVAHSGQHPPQGMMNVCCEHLT